jgi:hypothetical protein
LNFPTHPPWMVPSGGQAKEKRIGKRLERVALELEDVLQYN